MAYMFKNSHEDCSVMYRVSRDEGKTFAEPITITPQKSFWVMNNDRLVQLRSADCWLPVAVGQLAEGSPFAHPGAIFRRQGENLEG